MGMPNFTLALPRLQAVEEDYIFLEVFISRTQVQYSQHRDFSPNRSIISKAFASYRSYSYDQLYNGSRLIASMNEMCISVHDSNDHGFFRLSYGPGSRKEKNA
jgi:hypothetical protein